MVRDDSNGQVAELFPLRPARVEGSRKEHHLTRLLDAVKLGRTLVSGAQARHRFEEVGRFSRIGDQGEVNVGGGPPARAPIPDLVFGRVVAAQPLLVRSLMPENGVIFSDGMEADFVAFNSGVEARIGLAAERGRIVV